MGETKSNGGGIAVAMSDEGTASVSPKSLCEQRRRKPHSQRSYSKPQVNRDMSARAYPTTVRWGKNLLFLKVDACCAEELAGQITLTQPYQNGALEIDLYIVRQCLFFGSSHTIKGLYFASVRSFTS